MTKYDIMRKTINEIITLMHKTDALTTIITS